MLQSSIAQYQETVEGLSIALDEKVNDFFRNTTMQNMIEHYLRLCSDEEYEAVANRAADYINRLAVQENDKRYEGIMERIREAEGRQETAKAKSGYGERVR